MSKSGPLEQMVLEAGDQPFSHLDLNNRAHLSQSGWEAKEFAQGKTRGSNLVRTAGFSETMLPLWISKTGEKKYTLHNRHLWVAVIREEVKCFPPGYFFRVPYAK